MKIFGRVVLSVFLCWGVLVPGRVSAHLWGGSKAQCCPVQETQILKKYCKKKGLSGVHMVNAGGKSHSEKTSCKDDSCTSSFLCGSNSCLLFYVLPGRPEIQNLVFFVEKKISSHRQNPFLSSLSFSIWQPPKID
ncbi:MAG: hypothetical protein FDW93_05465 [Bergeyella sp.]|nr:hypothetical protein [Bergeyella sp.]